MLERLHHVAFVVESVDSAMEYVGSSFGLRPISRERFVQDGVDLAIYQVGDTFFEVTAPLRPDCALGQYLAERGPGIHHVAFGVADISNAMSDLGERRVKLTADKPQKGRSGWTVASIDSNSELGAMLQLVQREDA